MSHAADVEIVACNWGWGLGMLHAVASGEEPVPSHQAPPAVKNLNGKKEEQLQTNRS